jgi:uncharacterized peroxidase-related enzyme
VNLHATDGADNPPSRGHRKDTEMTILTVHTKDSAPAASRPILERIGKAFGFVPNLYAVFAESPAALQGALAISEAFSKTSLSPAEQQLVALATSEANDCEFCMAAHSALAKHAAGVAPAIVAAVRNRKPLSDPKLDALVTFTRRIVEQRGFIAAADVAAFIGAGYTKAQLIEVLFGVGMKTFNNYADHIAQTPLNAEFKAEAWQAKPRAA